MIQAIGPRIAAPQGKSSEAAWCGAGLAIASALVCIAGSIIISVSKKGGWEGNVIHNMELYQKGFICSMVGLGGALVGFSIARCA